MPGELGPGLRLLSHGNCGARAHHGREAGEGEPVWQRHADRPGGAADGRAQRARQRRQRHGHAVHGAHLVARRRLAARGAPVSAGSGGMACATGAQRRAALLAMLTHWTPVLHLETAAGAVQRCPCSGLKVEIKRAMRRRSRRCRAAPFSSPPFTNVTQAHAHPRGRQQRESYSSGLGARQVDDDGGRGQRDES